MGAETVAAAVMTAKICKQNKKQGHMHVVWIRRGNCGRTRDPGDNCGETSSQYQIMRMDHCHIGAW